MFSYSKWRKVGAGKSHSGPKLTFRKGNTTWSPRPGNSPHNVCWTVEANTKALGCEKGINNTQRWTLAKSSRSDKVWDIPDHVLFIIIFCAEWRQVFFKWIPKYDTLWMISILSWAKRLCRWVMQVANPKHQMRGVSARDMSLALNHSPGFTLVHFALSPTNIFTVLFACYVNITILFTFIVLFNTHKNTCLRLQTPFCTPEGLWRKLIADSALF